MQTKKIHFNISRPLNNDDQGEEARVRCKGQRMEI